MGYDKMLIHKFIGWRIFLFSSGRRTTPTSLRVVLDLYYSLLLLLFIPKREIGEVISSVISCLCAAFSGPPQGLIVGLTASAGLRELVPASGR